MPAYAPSHLAVRSPASILPARALTSRPQRHSRRPWLHRNVISAIFVAARAASKRDHRQPLQRTQTPTALGIMAWHGMLRQRNLHRVARVMVPSQLPPRLRCLVPALLCSSPVRPRCTTDATMHCCHDARGTWPCMICHVCSTKWPWPYRAVSARRPP